MTDYLVYKVNGELILHSHCQDVEEDLLLHDMVPGEDVVVVTDPAREGSETSRQRLRARQGCIFAASTKNRSESIVG